MGKLKYRGNILDVLDTLNQEFGKNLSFAICIEGRKEILCGKREDIESILGDNVVTTDMVNSMTICNS